MDKELKSIISSLVPPGNLALCISEFNPVTQWEVAPNLIAMFR